jgi:hypothetical protein
MHNFKSFFTKYTVGRRYYLFPAVLICFLIVPLCSTSFSKTSEIIIEPSAKTKPDWINKSLQDGTQMFFTGMKSQADTLEEGQNAAINDAYNKISNFIGVKIESSLVDIQSDYDQKTQQKISSKTDSLLEGATVVEIYYEKITRVYSKKLKIEKYDVYALLSISKDRINKEHERQMNLKSDKIKIALSNYMKGKQDENNKKFLEACRNYKTAKSYLSGTEEVIPLENTRIKNNQELLTLVNESISRMDQIFHEISNSVIVNCSNDCMNKFSATLNNIMTRNGFFLTKAYPYYKISGNLDVYESSYIMNNYCYYAEGSVSLLRTEDNVIVSELVIKSKGFAKTQHAAIVEAASEAGKELGNKIIQSINNKSEGLK